MVSRQSKSAGGKGANGSTAFASLSNSGRIVAFQTDATNLGGPIMSSSNSYVYDRKQRRAILVSRAGGGGPGANEYAGEPALAGGGRFVAFSTPADNIDPPGEPAYHGNFPANTNVYRFQFDPEPTRPASRSRNLRTGPDSSAGGPTRRPFARNSGS